MTKTILPALRTLATMTGAASAQSLHLPHGATGQRTFSDPSGISVGRFTNR